MRPAGSSAMCLVPCMRQDLLQKKVFGHLDVGFVVGRTVGWKNKVWQGDSLQASLSAKGSLRHTGKAPTTVVFVGSHSHLSRTRLYSIHAADQRCVFTTRRCQRLRDLPASVSSRMTGLVSLAKRRPASGCQSWIQRWSRRRKTGADIGADVGVDRGSDAGNL